MKRIRAALPVHALPGVAFLRRAPACSRVRSRIRYRPAGHLHIVTTRRQTRLSLVLPHRRRRSTPPPPPSPKVVSQSPLYWTHVALSPQTRLTEEVRAM